MPGLHELEAQKNNEVNEFRTKMRTFCEEKAQQRQMLPWQQWMEYNFPCQLEPCCSPPSCWAGAKSKSAKKILINVKFEASDVSPSAVVAFLHIGKGYSKRQKGIGAQTVWEDVGLKQVCGGGFEVGVTDIGKIPLPRGSRFPESPGSDASCVLRVCFSQRPRRFAQSKMSLALKKESFMLQQDPQDQPVALMKSALKKKATVFRSVRQEPEDYTLQVNGTWDFIYGNQPLSQFKVSRQSGLACLTWVNPV